MGGATTAPAPVEYTPVDYRGCGDDDLDDALGQLHALECAIRAQQLAITAEIGRRELCHRDGASTLGVWLAFRLGWEAHHAARFATIAAALTTLPALAAAHATGQLAWDQLVPAAALADPATDAAIAHAAAAMTPRQLALAVRAKHVAAADADTDEHKRRLWCRRDHRHGGTRFGGWLPDDTAHTVFAALDAIIDRDTHTTPDAALDHYDIRRADALVTLAATTTDPAAAPAARITIHLHPTTTDTTGDTTDHGGGWKATLPDGTPIPAAVADYYHCTADVEPCRDAHDHSTQRHPPRTLRRRVTHRDHATCRFPGCHATHHLHAHHIHHWPHGPTHLDNLVLLCPRHHRLIHTARWTITGTPQHHLTFTRPDGTPLTPGPTPLHPTTQHRATTLLTTLDTT